jgi:hypothetical protein
MPPAPPVTTAILLFRFMIGLYHQRSYVHSRTHYLNNRGVIIEL